MMINSLEGKSAIAWIKKSYKLYKVNPMPLTLIGVILPFLPFAFGKVIPILGFFVGEYIQLILGIGFYRICKSLQSEGAFDLKDLFKDFGDSRICQSLLTLQLIKYLMLILGIGFLVVIDIYLGLTSKDLMGILQIINTHTLYLIPDSIWIILFMNVSLLLIGLMLGGTALFFAPPLIAFEQLSIMSAFKQSLRANFTNMWPFIIFFLVAIPILLLGILTIGLGFFIIIPVFSIVMFLAYEDLFSQKTETKGKLKVYYNPSMHL